MMYIIKIKGTVLYVNIYFLRELIYLISIEVLEYKYIFFNFRLDCDICIPKITKYFFFYLIALVACFSFCQMSI